MIEEPSRLLRGGRPSHPIWLGSGFEADRLEGLGGAVEGEVRFDELARDGTPDTEIEGEIVRLMEALRS